MIGNKQCYVSEVSEVDPREQTLTMKSRNWSFNDIMVMDEHIEYRPDPTNPNRYGYKVVHGMYYELFVFIIILIIIII